MSDVEAVSSLPAALDVNQSPFVKVNQSLGPPSPKRASPPSHLREDASNQLAGSAGGADQPSSPKADSEAETIIQSGRESLSPEKRRKYIKHDPKRRDDGIDKVGAVEGDLPNDTQVRKRNGSLDLQDPPDRDCPSSLPSRAPSPSVVKIEKSEEPQLARKRENSNANSSAPKDKILSRKRSFSESVESDGYHLHNSGSRWRKDINGVFLPRPASNDRSVSPVRSHKRTISGPQLGGGDVYRKRKAPTPLITGFQRQSSEDRHSISSSTSGSPLPSAHMRKLAYLDGASASPARPMGHKKQRDQNGRTRLARACAAQELEAAIARHAERPDDLNVADNAGNTPLQIAALEGCAPIVEFLLEAGCEIDTKNIDKDTPLIDAVENGHYDVVKLLLAAGANPRTVNAEGDEPYELVPSDSEEYEDIRRALADAKANPRPGRRSEERAGSNQPMPRGSAASPRNSPPVNGPRNPPLWGAANRRKNVRSEATRNDLLWTKATPENLQAFASKGDMAGVATILNVGQKADAESMIAAAKGGYDEVLSLLLGMGDADPDPDPVKGSVHKPGYNTPMLAAIGRGSLPVVKLLLDQPGFNPTRRLFRDQAYYELSKERRGENYEEEYEILKEAYDNYSKAKKPRKSEFTSPRRPRDRDKENKRPARKESLSPAHPRKIRSPNVSHKDNGLSKEKRRELGIIKEKSFKPKPHREGSDNQNSDFDTRSDSSRPKVSRDHEGARGEDAPKRRRLIPGRPPQDRERRRPSLLSSDSLSGRDESTKPHVENPEPTKNGSQKRVRSSDSPEPRPRQDSDRHHDIQKKKRRVLSEDGAPNLTNGGLKKGEYRHKEGDEHTGFERDSHKGDKTEQNPVKQERKHENDLDAIPIEEHTTARKTELEERQRADARKKSEERVAEEKRLEEARVKEEEQATQLAREKAEEEERRRKDIEQRRIKQAEDERQRQLELERLRLAKMRREQEEQEQRRREALPSRLCIAANLVGSGDSRAKSPAWLKKFMPVVTASTKQLDPSCATEVADDKWVPNYLIAPLLATNDLQLSQYASWEKRNATPTQRMNLWRVTRRMLVQADDLEFHDSSFGQIMQKDCEARPKYFDMEHIFWVRLSDFMDLVPHIPHLHGLDIQFLRMHIDPEPSEQAFELLRTNGHTFGSPHEDVNGLSAKGLTNGYGHPRPSTYV